jgi:putative MATE family efflux protein
MATTDTEVNSGRAWMLGNEKVGKLLWKLSIPSIIGLVVQATYNLVDTIFVGRAVGVHAIAGLTVALPLQILIMAIIQTVAVGASSVISRSLGAGDKEKADHTLGNATTISLILGVLITILGLIFMEPLLTLFGGTETITPYARDYLSIILLGTVFFSYAGPANELARAEGNAKIAMFTMILSAITNIILDAVFILGFGMGVKGAALATIIAQAVAAVKMFSYFMSGKSMLRYRRKNLKPDRALSREIFAVGSSAFIRHGGGSLTMIVLNQSLVHYGGEIAIAVYGIINKVLLFTFLPMFGIVQGFQPIVGFNYGANKISRVKQSISAAIKLVTIWSTIMFGLIILFPGTMVGIFSQDKELLEVGGSAIQIVVAFLPFIGFQVICAGLFQSIGKATQAFILAISRQMLFLIPLLLLLPLFFGLQGIWLAFPATELLSMLLTAALFIRQWSEFNKISSSNEEKRRTEIILDAG